MKKRLKSILRTALFFHESRIAPIIAIYFFWLYWPLYKILKSMNICFVVNIAGGVGHILCELDLFLRQKSLGEIDLRKRYVWIRKNDPFSSTCVKFYGKYFWFAKANYLFYELFLPLTIRFKDITFDAGLSGLLWQLDEQGKYICPIPGQNYLNLIPLSKLIKRWIHYYQVRAKTLDYYPLSTSMGNGSDLIKLVGAEKTKKALIHIKESKGNATAAATDPASYLETLAYLHKKGYQLVFVGREKMPFAFSEFPIINYGQSPFASFENDILLFQNAVLAIIGGSGISFLADCYKIPYLYVNSWHLPSPTFSHISINVPTLLQKKGGEFLSFKEQKHLYGEIEPDGKVPRLNQYIPRNASSDEILAGVWELEKLMKRSLPFTPLQEAARKSGEGYHLYESAQRFSQYFLEKHREPLGFHDVS